MARFLHNPHYIEKLVHTCVNGTEHSKYLPIFQKAWRPAHRLVHEHFKVWRWGTIVKVLEDILHVQGVLCKVWSLRRFAHKSVPNTTAEGSADNEESSAFHRENQPPDLLAVDTALKDPLFFPYCRMLCTLDTFAEEGARTKETRRENNANVIHQ